MSTTLKQKIGFWSAVSIVVGSIIGAGVFMKPASMAAELGSPVWLTVTWVVAGLFSFLGALVYAELGAMMPQTGGIYVYFQKMYGEFVAFLYGWAAFAVINTAAVAAMSFVCAQYADHFLHLPRFDTATEKSLVLHLPFIGNLLPLENFGVKSLAAFIVIFLSYVNYRSVKGGSMLQLVSTFIKMLVIGGLVAGILFSGNGTVENFVAAEQPKQGTALLNSIIVAMTGAFFAYDGWINITFVAGEIKDPQRNIPRSLFAGVLACIIIYLLVNQAYLYVLPVEKLATSPLVAADAISIAWGSAGGSIIAALIVICTFGAVNGNILSVCRVTYAMGKDRVFSSWAGREHPRFQTPGNAIWLHAVWTALFIFSGSFDMLADMFVFVTWIAYGAGAVGVMLLRKRMKDMPRPYRIWGYPYVPIVFIAFSAFYLGITVYNDITNYINDRQPVVNSLLGLVITGLGVPVYYFYRRRRQKFKV